MRMTWGLDDGPRHFLLASVDVLDPLIGQDIVETGTVLDPHGKHPADDIATFARQEPEQTPGSFDDLLALARRLG